MLQLLDAGAKSEVGNHRQPEIEIVKHVREAAVFLLDPAGTNAGRAEDRLPTHHVVEVVALELGPQSVAEPVADAALPREARIKALRPLLLEARDG